MKKYLGAAIALLLSAPLGHAQPATTRPSLIDMLAANCPSPRAIIGGAAQSERMLQLLLKELEQEGIFISLPFTAQGSSGYIGNSFETATATSGWALVASASSVMSCRNSVGATYIVTGQTVVAQVQYEVP